FFTSYTIDRINRVTLTPHSPHTTIFLSKFTWLDERAWDRKLGYAEDSLVSDVTVSHPGLGISVRFEDYIDLARNWFIRNLSVTSAVGFTVGRVFLHYDWYIEGSDIGNTVLYDPR